MTHSHGVEPNFVPRAKLVLGHIMEKVKAPFTVGEQRVAAIMTEIKQLPAGQVA